MDIPRIERQLTTSIEILAGEVELHGLQIVDVGCGRLGFSRHLLNAGAQVFGVDPDPVQAEENRQLRETMDLDRFEFIEAGAESIPLADQSMDGVVFSFSLHHMPQAQYPKIFDEVNRLLKEDGFLCVIEPADGPLNQVLKLFHDEDQERKAAQQALVSHAAPKFPDSKLYSYHSFIEYDSFEQFAQHFANQSFNESYTAEDVYRNPVRERFEELGAPDYKFVSPKLMFLGGAGRNPKPRESGT